MPKPRRVVVGVALAAMLGALIAPADAQTATPPPTTTSAPSEKLSSVEQQLRDAYDDASAQEAATLDAYKASLEKTAQIEAQLAELDSAITTVSGYLQAAQGKVAEAQASLAAGEARRAEVEKALTVERARLDKRAISAYVSGDSRQVELEAILGASELRELESTHAYSSAIVDDQLDAVLKVKALEAEATAIRDRLATAAATIRDSRDKIASFEAELSTKKAQTTALREAQVAETAHQADLLAGVRAKKQSYLDRLRALERESDGIALALRTAQAGQAPVFDLPKVRSPLDKLSVDSAYGYRVHPIFGETRLHTGADLNAPSGTAIRAAAAGKVIMAESEDGYGNVLVIDHGSQVATAYAHMSSFGVRVGDVVARGQIIGKAGATGYATGPHLHFEYRVAGAPIDPMPLVDAAEPVACAVLNASRDAVDLALLKTRLDCAPPATTTTTTTTTRPPTQR